MNNTLLWMSYIFSGLAAAAFAYGMVQMLFLTRYADYQERMLRSFNERGGSLSLVIDPQKLQHISILLCGGLFLLGILLGAGNIFVGMFLGGILVIPGLLMPRVVFSILLARRLARISEQLPTGLELLVNSMRAGLTLSMALERNLERMPEELREEFGIVLHDFRLGTSLSDALNKWSRRLGTGDVKLVASAAALSLRCGGSLADAFQTLADIIRQRADFNKEVKALTAEGRYQALLMTALPFVIMIIMTLINRDTMMVFLESRIGQALLILMVGMQIGAFFWIRKLVTFDL